MRRLPILLTLLMPAALFGADGGRDAAPLPEPPDLPPPVESGEELEPDITIRREGDRMIQEYRINGRLYMVKITPDVGPPYYLIDPDGDGNLDVRRSDLEEGLRVPHWIIFKW